jgi:hypothetical protein
MRTTDADVTFEWAPGRFFLARLAMGLFGGLCGVLVALAYFLLRAGRIDTADGVFLVIYGLGYPLGFAGLSLLFARNRPALIRLTPAGIELAASRCDGVVVGWAAVSSARLRRRWPFTLLEIVAVDQEAVEQTDRGGRRPAQVRAQGRTGYVVDVDVLQDRPDVIRAELDRRGCPLDPASQRSSR